MKLMVLDGNSILNRSYYGIRPLTTKDGFYTQAIYGFLVTMARLEDEERPDAVCATFDRREPTFLHLEYEGYKAQRKGMPEELAMQLPVMKEVLDAMNIPRYELAGYEADDLIGTISRRCEAAGWDCVAATGDKDSLQLITELTPVKLISTRMGQTTTKRMTPETFAEEYGFEPIHIIDLKALMGDASDNIPGVPGIGEKTAMALVQKYRSIDEIYRLLPELDAKPGVIKKLTEGEERARQSYHLATILTDAPLEFTPQDNLRKAPSDALYPLLMHLEFHKLIERMGLKPAAEPLSAAETVECTVTAEAVTSTERAKGCLVRLRAADHVTVLALPDLSGVIVEWEKSEKETLSAEFFFDRYSGDWNALLRALFSADIKKVSHNVKDLMHTLLENGLPAEGFVFDTALAAYLIDATAAPVCMIAPISSWAAAVSGIVDESVMSGTELFVRAIPWNYYSLFTLVFVVGLSLMLFDYGPMKLHEMNARLNGDLFTSGERRSDEADIVTSPKGRVVDLVLPVLVLIACCVTGMMYVCGFFSGTSFAAAFAGTDASIGLP